MKTCDRCGDRNPTVRMSLVNLAREARHEGRTYTGPDYAHEHRCADREACAKRSKELRP